MQSKKDIVLSILFVIIFWIFTTFLITGIYHVINAVDITEYANQIFGI